MNRLNVNSNMYDAGNIMPLLMNFTPSTKIQEETNPYQYFYNDGKQIVAYDTRTVGTHSLKSSSTRKKSASGSVSSVTDRKNAVDDSKWVSPK